MCRPLEQRLDMIDEFLAGPAVGSITLPPLAETRRSTSNGTLQIDLADPVDLEFWALVFDVSVFNLRRAVTKVGVRFDEVAAYLRSNARKSS